MLLHLGLFLVLFSGACLSADVSVNNGGIYLEVFRETAQVKIGYQSNLTADNYSIAFQVTEISELYANMSKLGNESGTYNHTFTSFVNVTTFSNIIDTTVNNISAKFFSMYLTLENGAIFQIAVTVFGASGTVNTASGQTITVAAGNILFTSNLTLWKFCGVQDYCMLNNATGEYIDATLTFTSPSAFSSKTHNVSFVSKYSLGGNSVLYFPTKVRKHLNTHFYQLTAFSCYTTH